MGNGGRFSKDAVGGFSLGVGGSEFKLDSCAAYEGFENVACTGGIGIESVKIAVQHFQL